MRSCTPELSSLFPALFSDDSVLPWVSVDIVDNGIGISREVFNNIFKDFFTTKKYGTGLGISFIKEIIKMHGGSVKYTSEENLGTKVIVLLPKEKSPKTFNNSNYY